MAIWSLPFCWELCDCSKPCVHIPSHAAAFQAVMKLVSMLDSCWPGQHLLALLCGRAEDGSHSPALPVPPPVCCQRWSSAPTHTRSLGTAGGRGPSGKEQLRLFLAFLEELLEREQPRRAHAREECGCRARPCPCRRSRAPACCFWDVKEAQFLRGAVVRGGPALRTGLLSAAPASPEEFAAPASAAGSGEIAACLA